MLKIHFKNEDGRTASALAQAKRIKKYGVIVYDITVTLPLSGRQRKPKQVVSRVSSPSPSRAYPVELLGRVACESLARNAGGATGWVISSVDDSQAQIPDDLVAEMVKPKVTPHKGGRTRSINVRVTPETHKKLKNLGMSISDWIETKINETV